MRLLWRLSRYDDFNQTFNTFRSLFNVLIKQVREPRCDQWSCRLPPPLPIVYEVSVHVCEFDATTSQPLHLVCVQQILGHFVTLLCAFAQGFTRLPKPLAVLGQLHEVVHVHAERHGLMHLGRLWLQGRPQCFNRQCHLVQR